MQVLLGKSERSFGGDTPWNIPKGHIEDGETELQCAVREFGEETGLEIPHESICVELGSAKTSSSRKTVKIFCVEHDYNPDGDDVPITSNTFTKEHPKGSGRFVTMHELESARYLDVDEALEMMFPYQRVFVKRLKEAVK